MELYPRYSFHDSPTGTGLRKSISYHTPTGHQPMCLLHKDTCHTTQDYRASLPKLSSLKNANDIDSTNEHYRDFDAIAPWHAGSQFHVLDLELQAWRDCLPSNFAFEERNMYTFRASCHLDIFLMTHIWYHQCLCELFGAWLPGHAASVLIKAPHDFVEGCREKALTHAKCITQLIRKILKMEPEHLFRDAWFGLCVLDSTRIQIAGLRSKTGQDQEAKDELIDHLKLHLRALNTTRKTIVLAEKIVRH